MSKCEVCSENLAKYRCPGCLMRTCSLPCVKQHKVNSGCTGERNKTAYIDVKNFSDCNLLNDYRLLEEIGRKTDNAYRDELKRKKNKPGFLLKLIDEARRRRIDLKTFPYPMSKRKNNKTTFHFKSKSILWQVELIFTQAESKFTAIRVSEDSSLEDILVPYIDPVQSDPVIRHRLKPYCTAGIQNCHVFMKVEGRPVSSVRYHELDLSKSLKDNLCGKRVIEYPILYIVLSDHCKDYPLLEDKTVDDSQKKQLCVAPSSTTEGVHSEPVNKSPEEFSNSLLVNQNYYHSDQMDIAQNSSVLQKPISNDSR